MTKMKKIRIIFVSILILNFAAPLSVFCHAQALDQPENLEEVKNLGEKALEAAREKGPDSIRNIWDNEVIPVWKKMFIWAKESIWDNHLAVWLKNIWNSVTGILRGEVEQRRTTVGEEFQKEKQEIKQEAPAVGKTIWEKFKELIK